MKELGKESKSQSNDEILTLWEIEEEFPPRFFKRNNRRKKSSSTNLLHIFRMLFYTCCMADGARFDSGGF